MASVNEQLAWFNQASWPYLECQPPSKKKRQQRNFVPREYFNRQVKEQNGTGFIEVLNEKINLPKSHINYFVLAEWNLPEERLYVHFEKDLQPQVVKEIAFRINRRSHEEHQTLLAK